MNDYTVIVKGENKSASNLFDVLDIIKKLEAEGKQVLVFSSTPIDPDTFKKRARSIYA